MSDLIFDAVREHAKTRADQAALIFDDRSTSYGDLAMSPALASMP